MSKLWICIRSSGEDFKVGKAYRLTPSGYLIDEDGDERLSPEEYNTYSTSLKFKLKPVTIKVGGRIENGRSPWFQKLLQKYKRRIK